MSKPNDTLGDAEYSEDHEADDIQAAEEGTYYERPELPDQEARDDFNREAMMRRGSRMNPDYDWNK